MGRMDTGDCCTYVRRQVGGNIEELREMRGISQSRLAEMVSINRSYLNQLAAGKANPSLDKLVKIADGLDVPLTDLFSGLDSAAPSKIEYDGSRARASEGL